MNDTSNRIELNGNRWIGYAEFGDPLGTPCIFIHGYGSSRWMAGWALPSKLLRHHAIRLIAVDRPHYGLSSPPSTDGFRHMAHDVAALADHLGFSRTAVAGVSMGAGLALALSAQHPDLVSSTTILSGMPPVDAHLKWTPTSRADSFYWKLARNAPRLLDRLCALSASTQSKAAAGNPDRLIERMERALPPPDRETFRLLLDNEASRIAFIADMRESTRQGGAATASDLRRHLQPWDFELADIESPVRLWHGYEDPKVPIELAQRLTNTLPHCTARYLPGGHFAPFSRPDEIMQELLRGGR